MLKVIDDQMAARQNSTFSNNKHVDGASVGATWTAVVNGDQL